MELLPFQKVGVEFLVNNPRALLGDEVGLGKTVQALAAVKKAGCERILIVCPAFLCIMWERAIHKQIDHARTCRYSPGKEHWNGEKFAPHLFYICSYQYLRANVSRLCSHRWDCVIADEAHNVKNYEPGKNKWKCAASQAFDSLSHNADRIWLLTGTPATKDGSDYFAYLHIIEPHRWGSWWAFREKHCVKISRGFVRIRGVRREVFSYKGLKESVKPGLRAVFRRIMLRRLLKNVLPDLPSKTTTQIPIEVDPAIIADCLKINPSVVYEAIKNGEDIPAHLMSVVRSIGMAKVSAAVEWIKNNSSPVVVFCLHTDVLQAIQSGLTSKCVVVTGAESAEEKQKAVDDFQSGAVDVILLNMKAGGTGLTLTRAAHMLIVELPWSPDRVSQAIGRIIRIGQVATKVFITYLFAERTLDLSILASLRYKSEFMRDVMGD